MSKCALVVALLAVPSLAAAYPIPAVPLWQLVERADRIVVAEVESTGPVAAATGEETDTASSMLDGHAARLRVVETLKGAHEPRMEVRYSPYVICPAPPRYVEGQVVLAFLSRSDKGLWYTQSRSYGTLYPSEEDQPVFSTLIRRAHALQASGGPGLEASKRQWLVDAAARRATRWHGLYELAPASDAVHAYYDSTERPDYLARLTPEQMEQLAGGFVAEPSLDHTLTMMLAALAGYDSDAVDETAGRAVDTLANQSRLPWYVAEAVTLLGRRMTGVDPFAERKAAAADQETPLDDPFIVGVDRPSDDDVREAWRTLRLRFGGRVPAFAPPPAESVPGVGPDTPL